MPLYSTDTSSKVIKDKVQNEPQNPGPEEKICPQDSQTNSWCYLFVHHAKVETINEKLILKNECPHVPKLAKFKPPRCPIGVYWNTLCLMRDVWTIKTYMI